MLQTADFLKFLKGLFFEKHQCKWYNVELYNVEISHITLLKSDFAREALLATWKKIGKNRKTHRNISGGVSFLYSCR